MKIFRLDAPPCESCETLRSQLDIANHERRQLLETIIGFTKPVVQEVSTEPIKIAPILPKTVLWRTRQQALEENDRQTAANLKKVREDNEALEREVLKKDDDKEQVNAN